MDKIIAQGKTTNEAIENGLKELKVSRNQVEIKVLEKEDKRSFFSILTPRVVKVELTLKETDKKTVNTLKKQHNDTLKPDGKSHRRRILSGKFADHLVITAAAAH